MRKIPLLIVALDAGEPECILEWARQGALPAIRSILERGTYGRMCGNEMISVHSTWITFFSGVSLREHGYYLARQLEPGTYQRRKVNPDSIEASPFWAGLDEGVRALVLDAFDTRPVPGINGYQISNWGTHNTNAPCRVLPENLMEELNRISCLPIMTDESPHTRWSDRRILGKILQRVTRKGSICRHLFDTGPFDVTVLGFADTHAASHRFGKYRAAGNTMENAILEVYKAIDDQIARLLDHFPEPPNVFVVTNSGICDGYPISDLLESFLLRLGYQRFRNGRRETWRTALAGCMPAEWKTKLESRRFRTAVDWENTTAFAIPANYTGYLRINLKGREPQGAVSPGKEYEAILDRIEEDLLKLVDEETKERVVEKVVRTTTAFRCDPPAVLPDLFVDWRSNKRFSRRILHPKTVLVQKRRARQRGNYHSATGLFLAAGPAITRSGDAGDFSPLDFAPLFRHLLNPGAEIPVSENARKLIS